MDSHKYDRGRNGKHRVMSSDGQMEEETEQIFRWMGRWMDGQVAGWKTAN